MGNRPHRCRPKLHVSGYGSGAVTKVNVYIIDTGVPSHVDLNLVAHVNFVAGSPNTDCHGHGTHVSGTVAARDNATAVVGVVPGAPITGVKVLDCNGSGSVSTIVRGIDWITAYRKLPAVANMSLGAARPEHSMMRCADLSRPEYSTQFPPETAEVTLHPIASSSGWRKQ